MSTLVPAATGTGGVNGVALTVLILLFALVTGMGFWATRWRRADSMESLDEWGLGGRRFGTWVTWFLLGGDLYTAYTFVAVPAAMFALGAVSGFFAVPYTIVLYPIIFIFMARLWSVSHRHGYVTPADFVKGRYGSRGLALAVSITGILATMPYIALQLVGIRPSSRSPASVAATRSPRTCRCSSRSHCWPPTPTPAACAPRRSSPSSRTR
jgi:SSS family solute:Na+ symporter